MVQWEQEELQLKGMKMTTNRQGDDLFIDRLLAYLSKELPFSIQSIKPLRHDVFLIEATSSKSFILKGFSSYHRLEQQRNFTHDLKRHGFPHTYSFLEIEKSPPLLFEQTYYGSIEYIPSAEPPFSYVSQKNRKDGIIRLEQFHTVTENLVKTYQKKIKKL